jgi:hypothetical protein
MEQKLISKYTKLPVSHVNKVSSLLQLGLIYDAKTLFPKFGCLSIQKA